MLKVYRLFGAVVAMFAAVSMVLEPVAYGQAKVNWAAQALKQFAKDNQKGGKPVTYKEFWEKNKSKLNPEWQRIFFPSVETQKDERLPQMDVISVKTATGQDSVRVVLTLENKKTISMELVGEQDKMFRINGQSISYEEFYNGVPMMEKLAQDYTVKAEMQRTQELELKSSILPSYQTFSRMTAQERAEYFLNLRHVIQAATEVNEKAFDAAMENAEKQKEGASLIQLIMDNAYAQSENNPKDWVGKKCIIAGYVGVYKTDKDGRVYCDSETAVNNYANEVAQRKAESGEKRPFYSLGCPSSNQMRCQPFIFGYERAGGGSLCVTIDRKANSAFQKATVECNKASPLRRETLAEDTQDMLKSMLKNQGKDANNFFKEGEPFTEEKYAQLKMMVEDFHHYIDQAIDTCKKSNNLDGVTKFGEKNQADACTALKERKLAFQDGINLIEGKYKKPTPTPVAPITQPPQDPQGQCEIEGSKKPGYYDLNCKCLEAGTGEAGVNGKPTIKEGPDGKKVCTPAPVSPICKQEGDQCELKATTTGKGICSKDLKCLPPPAQVKKENDCSPLMEPGFKRDGAPECVGRSSTQIGDTATKKNKKKKEESFCDNGVCAVIGISALMMYAGYRSTRSKQVNKPGNYTPPAPPAPFTPIPQPTPVPGPGPISGTLPTPNPATGEGTNPTPSPSPAPVGSPGSVR